MLLAVLEIVGELLDGVFQLVKGSVVGDHQVGRSQPSGPAWLRTHSALSIGPVHSSTYGTLESYLVRCVHHHRRPTQGRVEDRNLDDGHTIESLQVTLDSTEDQGMGNSLESSQLGRVVENDGCQGTSIDLIVGHDLGPSGRDCDDGLVFEHGMTHGVGVDSTQTEVFEKPSHLALTRPDASGDQPTSVPGTHNGRR